MAQPQKLPSLQEAVEELRRDPKRVVRAQIDDLKVEIKIAPPPDIMEGAGPWQGESTEELLKLLHAARLDDDHGARR